MTAPAASPIIRQADEVELAALNERGHLAVLREAVRKGKRSTIELSLIEARIPVLEDAARTLRWVQAREAELRERFGLGREEEAA